MTESTPNNTGNSIIAHHGGTLLFIVIAGAIFAAIYFAYEYFFVGTSAYFLYIELYGLLASKCLSLLGVSHEFIIAVNEADIKELNVSHIFRNTIKNDDLAAKIVINKEADVGLLCSILIAGIAAWPGGILKKIVAIFSGVIFVFVLNVLRVTGIFAVDIYAPLQLNLYKETVLPLCMVLLTLAFFLCWVRISGTHPDDKT